MPGKYDHQSMTIKQAPLCKLSAQKKSRIGKKDWIEKYTVN